MAAHERAFIVVESDHKQILRVTTDGDIARLTDLSNEESSPRGIATTPAGEVLVGLGSRIVSIADDGTAVDVWTGLDSVGDIAVAQDGTVYTLEAGGSVLRQSSDDARKIAAGFSTPTAMALGPDGGLCQHRACR